ncbi:ATP-dependent sacrificial sulfur transferase LarE [Flavobacteriaceae bacterium F89]|uniref:ATP-dependent sacrificial sulfur transferase LarE n=1 Tax=Cerina litoralis TaxID=2874477 RepID=A0AAE3EYT6_9FLAO|nr:ATP-dependent sacrificial sulfur transferase LarE [Cerina litoralis]MCG2462217.1 ATP-dependent sacrificial sulfur transferase LarE [Cerina litoralis]
MDEKLIIGLKNWFAPLPGTITAFSGGIDSALVLLLSRKFLGREKAIGVISNSESLKDKDYQLAVDFAGKNDIVLETIRTEELADANYNANPANRCYFCKTHLYNELEKMKIKYPGFVVLNGTNKDDFSDYRPGLIAADQHRVRSPLSDLGLGKDDVRRLAKHFGIPFWNKPASPCLSSRIPYGNKVTGNKLDQIERAEGILNDFSFHDVRVRHYEKYCRIEVPLSELERLKFLSTSIIPLILKLGFKECVIEEKGLVSGNLNKVLNVGHG